MAPLTPYEREDAARMGWPEPRRSPRKRRFRQWVSPIAEKVSMVCAALAVLGLAALMLLWDAAESVFRKD